MNFKNPRKNNFCLMTDAYKLTHYRMLPPDTMYIYSYLESRGATDKGIPAETLFYGLQILLKQLEGELFDLDDIKEAKEFTKHLFGNDYFNEEGWTKMLKKHKGRLPIKIKAVAEGTVVPSHNILVSVENTDSEFPWIVGHIETLLLAYSWYPTTVATTSYGIKKLIAKYDKLTGGSGFLDFHLNDFGYRGVSSNESAGIGGSAHLINFKGTDNLIGIIYANEFYKAEFPIGMSVPASEHSATITWGEENESLAYKHFLTQYPEGLISIVSDSFDIHNAVKKIFGEELKHEIMERNGKLVVRPDSGYPPLVSVQVLESLYKAFGGSKNEKGFIDLNPKVGIIYGDFIKYGMIDDILAAMVDAGFSTNNIVFGMGGALLQQVNRDTFKFAFKTSAIFRESQKDWIAVSKHPISGDKTSKSGRMMLILDEDNNFRTIPFIESKKEKDLLKTVFVDGKITQEYTFLEIRERAKI